MWWSKSSPVDSCIVVGLRGRRASSATLQRPFYPEARSDGRSSAFCGWSSFAAALLAAVYDVVVAACIRSGNLDLAALAQADRKSFLGIE